MGLAGTLAGAAIRSHPNMNGAYPFSSTPGATPGKFPHRFSEYPEAKAGGRAPEFFDVYSPPITTLYSQVFWTKTPNVPLPADLVKRFAGKGMAVIGFEVRRAVLL